MEFRAAHGEDVSFLWQMLTLAASMPGEPNDVVTAQNDAGLRDYVSGFGRVGDLGVIALDADARLGAVWVRLAPAGPISPAKVWTHEVPELAIATTPQMRGRGLGTALLRALFDAARGKYPAIALSVRSDNPAVHLYLRVGFEIQRELVNRVGTKSLAMRKRL